MCEDEYDGRPVAASNDVTPSRLGAGCWGAGALPMLTAPLTPRSPSSILTAMASSTSLRMRMARLGRLSAEARGLVGNSAWGRSMFARRGGLAMATHGRHIFLAT